MSASITFNVDRLIRKLDILQKSHLPKAAEQALKSFGFDARELLQMEKTKTCVVSSVKEPVYLLIHPLVKHRPMPEDRAIESVINYCRVIYSAEALVVVEIK